MLYCENYGIYAPIFHDVPITVKTSDITAETHSAHFMGVFNVLLDAIETETVQDTFITIVFDNGKSVELSLIDYWFNLIMWKLIISTGEKIQPKHIFWDENITRKSIKIYIDKFFIEPYKDKIENYLMNNMIDDAIGLFRLVDRFSFYLADTINLEDSIMLMKADPEFYQLMHMDLSGVPIEDVKNEGMKGTARAIELMKNAKHILGHDHCLADSWRAREAINDRQYKEFSHNIGSKPNNEGGVWPEIINRSFLTGGVKDPMSLFIESYTGRLAQIMSKNNVGDSGHFARLLGLNSTDTIINPDPNYVCDSKNFQIITVKDKNALIKLKDRYYRTSPMGVEKIIHESDEYLIGKKIWLRSPMTCASFSRGQGVCYRCYGKLAYTNADIVIGKYAAEALSSVLTQTLLSAKHLLETKVIKLVWPEYFNDFLEIEGNAIKLSSALTVTKGFSISIDPEEIMLVNDDGSSYDDEDAPSGLTQAYNEYVTEFNIITPNGEEIPIHTAEHDRLYISEELNEAIRKSGEPVNGKVLVKFDNLVDSFLFFVILQNNELSKTMERIMDIINKNSVTKSMDRHELLQAFLDAVIEGGLDTDSIHLETILANQIRAEEDILDLPDWSNTDEPYQILTLNQALTDNPSVSISLMYQKLSRALYNPLTFRKNKPSFMDLFFMKQPQIYLSSDTIVESEEVKRENNIVCPIVISEERPDELGD